MDYISAADSLSPSEGERVRVRGVVIRARFDSANAAGPFPLTPALSPSDGERGEIKSPRARIPNVWLAIPPIHQKFKN